MGVRAPKVLAVVPFGEGVADRSRGPRPLPGSCYPLRKHTPCVFFCDVPAKTTTRMLHVEGQFPCKTGISIIVAGMSWDRYSVKVYGVRLMTKNKPNNNVPWPI